MTFRSLRARLIAGTSVWLVVALLAGGFALSHAFRESVEAGFDERLESLLLAVVAGSEAPADRPLEMVRELPDARFERAYSGWYWQVDDGKTRLRSRSLWDTELELAPETLPAPGETVRLRGPRGEWLRARGRAVHFPSRSEPVLTVVALPEQELQTEIDRFDRLLVLSLGLLGLGLVVAVAVQVAFGLRPLRHLAERLEDVRSGRVARLDLAAPREIETLVSAMNDVLDQDAARIDRARTDVGNLAHALKTPLAILAAEAGRRSGSPELAQVRDQVGAMSQVVDRYLTRAAAAGSRRTLGARTETAPVVTALRATLERIYAERRIAFATELEPGAVFAGERQDLEEMLGNLMDNAWKWARSRVRVSLVREAGTVRFEVHDDGPGLAPEAAEHALQRGTRLDENEPGSGLGLSIVADLADLYGGSVALFASDLGGLCARLTLPAR